jgi:heat shock protein HtpX
MKRQAYGRDVGLSLRMTLTMFLLGLLYVGFALILFYALHTTLVVLVVIVVGLAFFQYFTSDKLALKAAGARVVSPEEAPQLHATVERLAAMANIQKPQVAIIDSDIPNAFATGRNQKHAVVAVYRGLLDRLDENEVEGVLAHELTHIVNRDVLVMTLASTFAMLAALITRFGLYAGFFGGFGGNNRDNNNGVPAWLVIVVVSALITGAPEYLMSALQKISGQMAVIPQKDLREVQALNAFFIIPARVKGSISELFMDHPPLEKRLAALEKIAQEMGRPVS